VGRELPTGTVTFLFTDVEGSTRLLSELGAERYADALAEHRRVVRDAAAGHGGVEVDTQGDAFFITFPSAPQALAAARETLAGLSPGPIRTPLSARAIRRRGLSRSSRPSSTTCGRPSRSASTWATSSSSAR
jgi:class 3 adenylate cyclase